MSRIAERFEALRERGEKALVVYLTAGDPSLEKTEELVLGLERAGVDIVEIGVPFSDPVADGPVIQAASRRALQRGVTLPAILEAVERVRKVSPIPIILFGYYNPVFSYGNKRFARRAEEAGVDGILVVDLPPEEAQELRRHTDRRGIDFISLIAPTTSRERIRMISRQASGFLYVISMTSVTGSGAPKVEELKECVMGIREESPLPLAVGFGISAPGQAAEIATFADGVVIGTAVVRMIGEHGAEADLVEQVSSFAGEFKRALTPAGNRPGHQAS